LAEASGSVVSRVGLESVGVIPPPQTLPNVMEGKTFAFRELLNVTVLVQKKLGVEPGSGCEEDRFTESDRCHRRLAEESAADTQRNSATAVAELEELRPHDGYIVGKRYAFADERFRYFREISQDSPAAW
jgi:hypothetical protein